jgi:morphogenetic protein associated with SpoVID
VQQWRQQFEKLESVDLRYEGQIIVNPDLNGMARQPALTPTAAKAAMAAGVKTAAIVNYEKYVAHPVAAPAPKKDAKPKAKAGTKAAVHRASTKQTPVKPAPAKPAPIQQAPVKQVPVQPVPVKQAPVNQAALKTKVNAAPVAAAKDTVAPHPVASPAAIPSAPPVAAATGQKKPSAGIPKETPQN